MYLARFENINTHWIFVTGDAIEIGWRDMNKQIRRENMHEKRFNLIHINKKCKLTVNNMPFITGEGPHSCGDLGEGCPYNLPEHWKLVGLL